MTSFLSALALTSVTLGGITAASAQRPLQVDSARTPAATPSASSTARPAACCDTTAMRAVRAGTDRLTGLVDAMNAAPASRKVAAMSSVVVELVNRQREMEAHMSGMQMSLAMTDTSTASVAAVPSSSAAAASVSAPSSAAAKATPASSSSKVHAASSPSAARTPSTAVAAATPAAVEDTASAQISAGRKVFHGPGTCAVCHGQKLEGTPMAPTLAAHAWKDAKGGGYDAILAVINKGVPGTAMVARPGGINSDDAARVAKYVWAVGQGKAKP